MTVAIIAKEIIVIASNRKTLRPDAFDKKNRLITDSGSVMDISDYLTLATRPALQELTELEQCEQFYRIQLTRIKGHQDPGRHLGYAPANLRATFLR